MQNLASNAAVASYKYAFEVRSSHSACHSVSAGISVRYLCAGADAWRRFASAHQNLAENIMGMLLETNNIGLLHLLEFSESLCSVVDKTVCVVLQAHHAKEAVQKVGAVCCYLSDKEKPIQKQITNPSWNSTHGLTVSQFALWTSTPRTTNSKFNRLFCIKKSILEIFNEKTVFSRFCYGPDNFKFFFLYCGYCLPIPEIGFILCTQDLMFLNLEKQLHLKKER